MSNILCDCRRAISNNLCGCEFTRSRGKRRRVGVTFTTTTTTAVDRLSHLPAPILCHILSFLNNTKFVVQTSVLSRVWRGVWKDVPALHLHRGSFRKDSSFERFVLKVLSLRRHLNLRTVCYIDNPGPWTRKHRSMFVKLMKYVVSYEAEHLMVHTGYVGGLYDAFRFSYLFGSILKCCNLKTLDLNYIILNRGFGWSGLQMLTTLTIYCCLLDTDVEEDLDLFSNLPSLMNLAMSSCFLPDYYTKSSIKIHGPQLVSLTLVSMERFTIEIFAPKLKVFSLSEDFSEKFGSEGFSRLTLTSLDRANIDLTRGRGNAWNVMGQVQVEQYVHLLFQSLYNAKTLQLSKFAIQVLKDLCEFLEQQPTPFKRLETLIVESDNLPYKLITYFLKGSSCEERRVLIDIGMRLDWKWEKWVVF